MAHLTTQDDFPRSIGVRGGVMLAAVLALSLLFAAPGHAHLPQQDGQVRLLDQANVRIDGEASGDQAGAAAASAGDVNGDGIDDVILGARLADQTGLDAGSAYVVFGQTDPPGAIDLEFIETRRQGFRIDGAKAGDQAGASVAGAGDVNGDGKDDVIVGAPDGGPLGEGTAYVVFGKADYDLVSLIGLETETGGGFAIIGALAGDRTGASVAGAQDVNGDEKDDVVVGAPLADANGRASSGTTHVIYGKVTPQKVLLGALGSQGFGIYGAQAGDHAGTAVAGAGFANVDAIPDLVVGQDGARQGQGAASVVFGKHNEDPIDLGASFAGYTFSGDAGDQAGAAVAGAGDQNGDGKDDVVIGAPKGCPDPNGCPTYDNQGAAYVIYGKTDTADVSANAIESGVAPRPGFLIAYQAPARGDFQLGRAVGAAGGDLDDDGIDDLAVGTPLDVGDPGWPDSRSGTAYAVFGQARSQRDDVTLKDAFDPQTGFRANGAASDDFAANAVSGGDVNDDGRADEIVGAPGGDNSFATDSGSVYVVFGFGYPQISYSSATYTGFLGSFKSIKPQRYEHTGPVTFTVDPPLPQGLTIDPQTGAISGAPTELDPETTHTITMTDLVDTQTATVKIEVKDGFSFLGKRPWSALAGGQTTLTDMTVSLGLGNLLLRQDDLTLPKPGPGDFTLTRTYNSYLAHNADQTQRAKGLFGWGWASTLDKSAVEQYSGDVVYYDGQGAQFTFKRQTDGTYTGPKSLRLTLVKKRPYGTGFTLTDKRDVVEDFDGDGHLIEIRDADINSVAITWLGQSPTQIQTGGQTATITTEDGLITEVTNPDGASTNYEYDDEDELTAATDLDGRKTTFAYDDRHKLTRTGSPAYVEGGGTVANDDCGQGIGEAVVLYDEIGRVTSITDERHRKETGNDEVYLCGQSIGQSTTYIYEPDITRCPDPVCATDPLGYVWMYALDDRLRPCEAIDGSHNAVQLYYDNAATTSTCPAATENDPANDLTALAGYRRDEQGYLRKLTTKMTYNARDNLTSLVEPEKTDGGGGIETRTTKLAYDSYDNLIGVMTPQGKRWRYTYSEPQKHHPTRIENVADTSIDWDLAYDTQGNLDHFWDLGGNYAHYSYDLAGRLSYLHYEWDYSYNVTYGVSQYDGPFSEIALGSVGEMTSYYQDSGRVDHQAVDIPDAYVLDADPTYDANGLLDKRCNSVNDPRWTYDKTEQDLDREANGKASNSASAFLMLSMVCNDVYSESPETESHHEVSGANRVRKTWTADSDGNGLGDRLQTAYLGSGVPFEVDRCPYNGEACELHPIQIITVDEQGNPVVINRYDENITQTSSFDYLNRETSRMIDPDGAEEPWLDETLIYNKDSEVTRISNAADESYDFAYTKTGWLTAMRNRRSGDTTRWTYDDAGRRVRETSPDGDPHDYFYDVYERLDSVSGNPHYVDVTAYNHGGQPTGISDCRPQFYSDCQAFTFDWDIKGRLHSRTTPGLRSRISQSGRKIIFGYLDPGNLLAFEEIVDGAGNFVDRTEYRYDAYGHLVAEIESDYWGIDLSVLATYNYDGTGRLISTTQNDTNYYYNYDALGNVIGLDHVSPQNELIRDSTYEYTPWGELTAESGAVRNPWRWQGAFWDEDLHMYYLGGRWYDPDLGQYINPPLLDDPKELAERGPELLYLNQSYAKNSPLRYHEPTGLGAATRIRQEPNTYFKATGPTVLNNSPLPTLTPQYWQTKRYVDRILATP